MRKSVKRLIVVIVSVGLIIVSGYWDRIFTNLQHYYYQIVYRKNTDAESRIEIFSFETKSYPGVKKEVKVYLPGDYDTATDKKFPVLYLLHGFPGSNSDWLINTNLQKNWMN